ncbi:MAG: hypothetical protein K2X27_25450 [Candidatus Obscuribacterales bacterium]|nr:hypothetical protein [Candidatus Obscuribacterales bacterium]
MKKEFSVPSIDPTDSGRFVYAEELVQPLSDQIETAVPFIPGESSYPEYFKEFVIGHLKRFKKHQLLVLPAGTKLSGDLALDFDADWIKPKRLAGIVCEGDLTIDGDLFNRTLSFGPLLFVRGNLQVQNLIKAGAPFIVLGNVEASGIVLGEYNDGVLRVGGMLRAEAYFLFDHDGYVRLQVEGPAFSTDEDVLRGILVDDVFENEMEDTPDADLLWMRSRARLPILS